MGSRVSYKTILEDLEQKKVSPEDTTRRTGRHVI